MGRTRTVVEDVAEMGIAARAEHLGAGMPWARSISVRTAPSAIGFQKLGQPVPDSNFVSELKSSFPQPAQR